MSEQTAQQEEEALGKAYDSRLMRRLLAYLRPYRGMTAGALALILVSSLLQLVGPLAVAVALDLFIRPAGADAELSQASLQVRDLLVARARAPSTRPAGADAELSQASLQVRDLLVARGIDPAAVRLEGLAVVSGIYFGALALTFCVLYAQGYLMQLMGQYVMNDMRRQVFGHLQRLPIPFFARKTLGTLGTAATPA